MKLPFCRFNSDLIQTSKQEDAGQFQPSEKLLTVAHSSPIIAPSLFIRDSTVISFAVANGKMCGQIPLKPEMFFATNRMV
jgi:hypothetical protein